MRIPFAVGVNDTSTMQVAPAGKVDPQVFADTAKSPGLAPPSSMPGIASGVGRLFVITMAFAELAVRTARAVKVSLVGVTDTGTIPFPVRLTVCGLSIAESVMLNVAVRCPVALGEKVTLIVQEVPCTSGPMHPAAAKSCPEAKDDTVISAPVRFVSVTVFGALVTPRATDPNEMAFFEGAKSTRATPLTGIGCGPSPQLSTIDADLALPFVRVAGGAKLTVTSHSEPGAIAELAQLSDSVKSVVPLPVTLGATATFKEIAVDREFVTVMV